MRAQVRHEMSWLRWSVTAPPFLPWLPELEGEDFARELSPVGLWCPTRFPLLDGMAASLHRNLVEHSDPMETCEKVPAKTYRGPNPRKQPTHGRTPITEK